MQHPKHTKSKDTTNPSLEEPTATKQKRRTRKTRFSALKFDWVTGPSAWLGSVSA